MKPSSSRVHHEPGEIVWARIFNSLENRHSEGKVRPVVILEPGDCQHLVVGLTTKPFYKTTGASRVAIPNPMACGLRSGGFIWGPRPSRCSRIDLAGHVGWADHALAAAIANMVDAKWHTIDRMLDAVARRVLGGDHGLAL
jgi:hypothetical protein